MCELIYCVYANVHTYYITTKFFQDFFCFFKKNILSSCSVIRYSNLFESYSIIKKRNIRHENHV